MIKLQRYYSIYQDTMVEDENGEYVKWEDVKNMIEALDRRQEARDAVAVTKQN